MTAIPKNHDMERCLEEIRNCDGMILSKQSFLRSIAFENKGVREEVLSYICNKCKALEDFLLETEGSDVEIGEEYDLKTILNFYKAVLNIPILADTSTMTEAKVPPQGNSSTYVALQERVDFYIVEADLDLITYVNKLGAGLEKLKHPEDKKWLLDFCRKARKCLTMFIPNYAKLYNNSVRTVQSSLMNHVCCPIELLFRCFSIESMASFETTIPQTPGESSMIEPCLVFLSQESNHTFVEVKRSGLELYEDRNRLRAPRKLARPSTLTDDEREGFHGVIFDICRLFRSFKLSSCICSDYKTNYIMQLAFDDEGWLQTDRTSIPIRTKVLGIEDSGLTTQMALCALIWDGLHQSREDPWNANKSLEMLSNLLSRAWPTIGNSSLRDDAPLEDFETLPNQSNRNILRYIPKISDTFCLPTPPYFNDAPTQFSDCDAIGNIQVLQKSTSYPDIILRFERDHFKQFFPNIALVPSDENQSVVMKIFDYGQLKRYHSMGKGLESLEKTIGWHQNRLINEIKCYEKIWEHNLKVEESDRIRTPRLHSYGNMHLSPHGHGTLLQGFFILLDYPGEQVEKVTETQYRDGVTSLERMGEIGVKNNDFEIENFRVRGENLVFFDLSSCQSSDHAVSNACGIQLLEEYMFL